MDLAPSVEGSFYGVFRNVEPGDDYELVFDEANGHCKWSPGPVSGWRPRSERKNAARIVVRAGYLTWYTALYCPGDVPLADGGADADASADAAIPDAGM